MMKSEQVSEELQVSLPVEWGVWIQFAWTEGRWEFLMGLTYKRIGFNFLEFIGMSLIPTTLIEVKKG